MWSKIKKLPGKAWRELQYLMSCVLGGLKRIWAETSKGFKESPWWKLVFIDLPIMVSLVVLSFTLSGYMVAEVAVLLIGSSLFFRAMPEDKGGVLLQHFGGLVLFTVGFGATLWAWFYFRELAWLMALSQLPLVTMEAARARSEAMEKWDAAHPPKIAGQEA